MPDHPCLFSSNYLHHILTRSMAWPGSHQNQE